MSVTDETVFLLHGLAAHRLLLARLQRALEIAGYRTVNWGYRSLWSPIETHVDTLAADVRHTLLQETSSRIHFVGHSMGSIIVRTALSRLTADPAALNRLGRFVMLGPPNRGSKVARQLSRPLGWLCPPLAELSDAEESFVNRLPVQLPIDVGVIAADSDLVVAEDATHLPCQRDWLLLPGHHSELLWRADTAANVIEFLRRGSFLASHSASQATPPAMGS